MPRTFFGPFQAAVETYSNGGHANLGRFPLGHILVLPDAREYRYALNDGTAEVAGNLYQSVAQVANHSNRACDVARAVDATVISATLGATSAAVDIYTEGTVTTEDEAGEGYIYRIRRAMTAGSAHASVATSSIITVNLDAGEDIQVALTTASEVTFTRNRWHQILIHPSPPTARVAGVSPGVAAADRFYWSQVKGSAAVLASGTLLAGLPVMPSITTDGSVESFKRRIQTSGTTALVSTATHAVIQLLDQDGTTVAMYVVVATNQATAAVDISSGVANNAPIVGYCQRVAASGEYSTIMLQVPD